VFECSSSSKRWPFLTTPFQRPEREEDSKLLRIDFSVVVQVPWNRELGAASFVQGGAQQQQIVQRHGNLRKSLKKQGVQQQIVHRHGNLTKSLKKQGAAVDSAQA